MMREALRLLLAAALLLNGYTGESGQTAYPSRMGAAFFPGQEAESAVVSGERVKSYPDDVVGIWQNSPGVGAGFTEVYWFERDGVFTWSENEGLGAVRLRYTTGEWYVEDGALYLSACALVVRQGGFEIPACASMANDRIGGELVRIDLSPEERMIEAYSLAQPDREKSEERFRELQMGEIWLYEVAADWEEKKSQLAAVRDCDPFFLEQNNEWIKAREEEWFQSH